MKISQFTFRTILFATTGMLSLASSCKKKPPIPPIIPPIEEGFILNFTGTFNGTALEYKTGEYTRENGEVIRISNWAMILSHLALVKTNDSLVPLGDGYLFVDFVGGKTKTAFKNVPAGNYKGLQFQLGVDSVLNHADPTIWPADHPLNANTTGLHWGWAGGYIFHALDGTFKTKNSDPAWQGLTLHAAGEGFTKDFYVPYNFVLTAGANKTASIQAFVDEFFKNPTTMSLSVDGASSHSVGTKEVALMKLILGNAGDVFKIKEVK